MSMMPRRPCVFCAPIVARRNNDIERLTTERDALLNLVAPLADERDTLEASLSTALLQRDEAVGLLRDCLANLHEHPSGDTCGCPGHRFLRALNATPTAPPASGEGQPSAAEDIVRRLPTSRAW